MYTDDVVRALYLPTKKTAPSPVQLLALGRLNHGEYFLVQGFEEVKKGPVSKEHQEFRMIYTESSQD